MGWGKPEKSHKYLIGLINLKTNVQVQMTKKVLSSDVKLELFWSFNIS